jgi:predicted transposase YdaD
MQVNMNKKDNAWKQIIDQYFPRLIEFYYPQFYNKIDWRRGYQSLDKELQQIVRQAAVGNRFVDKLIQVHTLGGEEEVVLVHHEIQGKRQKNFEERLFQYYCLLYLHYKKPIIILVILIDPSAAWHPESYEALVWGKPVLTLRFNTLKVIDYKGKEETLRQSDNPFAWVTLVQLAEIETKKDAQKRFNAKKQLTRLLHRRGWCEEEICKLYLFIDWILTLPEDLEVIYNDDIKQFEEECDMPFISGMERRGIERGRQEGMEMGRDVGRQEGEKKKALNIAKKMLSKKLDRSVIQELTDLSDEELDKLL